MRSLLFSVWVGFGCMVATEAIAGFINNKTQWDALEPIQKDAYVKGAFDMWTGVYFDAETAQYINDMQSCLIDLEMTSRGVVEIIDAEYRDLSRWERPPYAAMVSGLRKVCLARINRARATRGEPALE